MNYNNHQRHFPIKWILSRRLELSSLPTVQIIDVLESHGFRHPMRKA